MRSLFKILILSVLAIFVFASTVTTSNSEDAEVRVGIQAFPTTAGNPLGLVNLPALYTFAALFDALTYVDQTAEAQPQLATSWTALSPFHWRFKLRTGVVFSNGETFEASTVVANIEILKSPESVGYVATAELSHISHARVVDPMTVDIFTNIPAPFLPQDLSMLRFVPPNYWHELGAAAFARDPVGTAAFKVEKWSATELKLEAWDGAWRTPKVERLGLFAVPNPSARLQGLLSGNLHLAVLLGPDEVDMVEAAGHYMSIQPEPGMIVLAFNLSKPSPLKDVRVRHALNFAVNKQGIVDGLLAGQSRVSTQTAPAIAFGFDPTLEAYGYDPERARALLRDAGYPDGFDMIAEVLNVTSSFAGPAYQQVVADLLGVGVRVELRAIPVPKYAQGLHQGLWDGEAFGIDYGIAPSLDALRAFTRHSCLKAVPWYCDEALMPLLTKAMQTFDLGERRTLTQQVLRHQRDQAPGILLYDLYRFDGVRRELKGYANHVGYIPYHELSLH